MSAALLYILLKLGAVPAFVGRSIVIVAHSWSCGIYLFSFPDALCYQIRGKHVFPNAVISQRYKLQLYHIEKGMQSAPFSISTENVYRIELYGMAIFTEACYITVQRGNEGYSFIS